MNNIIIEDHINWVLIDISTPKHPNKTAKVSKIDYDRFAYRAFVGGRGYLSIHIGERCPKIFHRLLFPKWAITDHINCDIMDNRRENLREATATQNAQNRSARKGRTCNITGIDYHKNSCKWRARIMLNGKAIYLGHFDNIEIAIGVRNQAEKELFGDFSRESHKDAEKTQWPETSTRRSSAPTAQATPSKESL